MKALVGLLLLASPALAQEPKKQPASAATEIAYPLPVRKPAPPRPYITYVTTVPCPGVLEFGVMTPNGVWTQCEIRR